MPRSSRLTQGFTLIELLVVIGIIGLLMGILVPVLSKARAVARRTACLSNLHQIGLAIESYANEDRNGWIPYGPPVAPPFTTMNFYPVPGSVTSLVSLQSGEPVGLGLMLDKQLSNSKKTLFCPGADQGDRSNSELAKVGSAQAQCDYYYRHASGGDLYTDPGTSHLKLGDLGANSQGNPIRALVFDVDFLCDPFLATYGIYTRTSHDREFVNVLYSDGHALSKDNHSGAYTIDARANASQTFAKVLTAFEALDREQ